METTQDIKKEGEDVYSDMPPLEPVTETIASTEENKQEPDFREDGEYEDVAEDPLVILDEQYKANNEFYDTTVAEMIAKTARKEQEVSSSKESVPSNQTEDAEGDSEEDEIYEMVKTDSPEEDIPIPPKNPENDDIMLETESNRVKQLKNAIRSKKMNQKSVHGDEFVHPGTIPKKAIKAIDTATNPTTLYMQMDGSGIDRDPESRVPVIKPQSVSISHSVWSSVSKTKQSSPTQSTGSNDTHTTIDGEKPNSQEEDPVSVVLSKLPSPKVDNTYRHSPFVITSSPNNTGYPYGTCDGCFKSKRSCICKEIDEILERRKTHVEEQTIKFSLDFEILCKIRAPSLNKATERSREMSPYASD